MKSIQILGSLLLGASAASAFYDCSNITLYNATVELDSLVVKEASLVATNYTTGTPEYCSIQVLMSSNIRIWLRLPGPETWNGNFGQYGCGGGCGFNQFETTSWTDKPLVLGYGISTNDMGVPFSTDISGWDGLHDDFLAKINWGYRATHLCAIASKMVMQQYYGKAPVYSYHIGGSTGGRQGLVEAQRYPDDFDGIFAAAPALNETGVTAYQINWNSRASIDSSSLSSVMTGDDAENLATAVLNACDGLDGLEDGIITDPRACNFDISTLVCGEESTETSNTTCLSAEAIEAARKIYQGPKNSGNDSLTLEGLLTGSEALWAAWYTTPKNSSTNTGLAFTASYLSFWQFWPEPTGGMSAWDFSMETPLKDTTYMENLEYGGIADLQKFQQLGSKLIMVQGMSDFAVAPWYARDYYQRVLTAMGGLDTVSKFFKYYEMPGVGHVHGGAGADSYPDIEVISAWVENGTEPRAIIGSKMATNGTTLFTRPFYPYPNLGFYKGSGDPNDAANFVERPSVVDGWWQPTL